LRLVTAESSLEVSDGAGTVSCVSLLPDDAGGVLVFAHGAGAGMHHAGMESLARALAGRGVATFRYQFPYMEKGRRFPDPLPLRLETVGAAIARAASLYPDLPLYAGGRSMGGRMSSTWVAKNPGSAVSGLVFFGFPLHPQGKPGTTRGEHLREVDVPMLFLNGTRDKLAGLDLLQPLCEGLGDRARLHVVEGADHGFHVLKRSGRNDDEVLAELARETRHFIEATSPGAAGHWP
jgi:predicted alpha/beta-hydrolase family hydrolase